MTEPLKFLADVPAMTGGKAAIMAAARALKADGRLKTPKPGESHAAWSKAAVGLVVEAIRDQLRAPLEKTFEAHLSRLESEYVLFEGEPPEDPGPEADAWNEGLNKTTFESLIGELKDIISAETLQAWIESDAPTSDLIEKILEHAVEDVGNAFDQLGIKPEDVESLITGIAPPADGQNGRRRRSASLDGPTPLTEAARAALTALHVNSVIKDVDVATALGVSRASVIGYREGKTLFSPSDEQISALNGLFDQAVKPLTDALNSLTKASIE